MCALWLQVVKDAVGDFLTKKKTRLSIVTVKALLRAAPSPEWPELLISHYNSARNDFLKTEAIQLLLVVLHPTKVGHPKLPWYQAELQLYSAANVPAVLDEDQTLSWSSCANAS